MDNGLLEGTNVNIKSSSSVSEPISRYDMAQVVTGILDSKGITVIARGFLLLKSEPQAMPVG